jgi:hypothetical protein
LNGESGWLASEPMTWMSKMMLIVTSPEIIANFPVLFLHIPI